MNNKYEHYVKLGDDTIKALITALAILVTLPIYLIATAPFAIIGFIVSKITREGENK